jgi:hypothetical protein
MAIEGDDDVTVTDQNVLSPEEQALEDQMRADGDGNPDDDGKPAPAKAPEPKKPTKPAAKGAAPAKPAAGKPQGEKPEGEGDGPEGEGEGAADVAGKNKMVPHAALHETREELKAARAAMAAKDAEHTATMAKAMDRFEKTLAAFAPKPPEEKVEPVPDFETDPAGWISHTMKAQGKTLEEVQGELTTLRQEKAQRSEQDQQVAVVRGVMDYAVNLENQFKAVTPDYDAASAFLIESRKGELADMGYDQNQVDQMIYVERLTIAAQAQQQKKNPAEIVYNLAKRRGYQAKAALVEEEEGEEEAPAQPAQEASRERLATAQKGRTQDQGLSGARGNAPSPLTAQRLLELPDAEFDKLVNTPEGRALLGA